MGDLQPARHSIAMPSAAEEGEIARAIAEVQAMVFLAKQFPRDEDKALESILRECRNPKLAEIALYTYTRGGSEIEDASIRLAEVMARHWGNIDYGFRELGRGENYSDAYAFSWDLESNVRASRDLQVKHTRDKKTGTVLLTTDRDIYEQIASQSQRRVRACVLQIIPSWIKDEAVDEVKKTLLGDDVPLEKRISGMAGKFEELDVNTDMLEKRLGKSLLDCNASDIIKLRSVYNVLKDGMATKEQFFREDDALDKMMSEEKEELKKIPEQKEQPKKEKPELTPEESKAIKSFVMLNAKTFENRIAQFLESYPTWTEKVKKAFDEKYERMMGKPFGKDGPQEPPEPDDDKTPAEDKENDSDAVSEPITDDLETQPNTFEAASDQDIGYLLRLIERRGYTLEQFHAYIDGLDKLGPNNKLEKNFCDIAMQNPEAMLTALKAFVANQK